MVFLFSLEETMKPLQATTEQKEQLRKYLAIMNDRSLSIGERRYGKMYFDILYDEIKRQNKYQ